MKQGDLNVIQGLVQLVAGAAIMQLESCGYVEVEINGMLVAVLKDRNCEDFTPSEIDNAVAPFTVIKGGKDE